MVNFDAILEATESSLRNGTNGAAILSEQHDVRRISTEGMSNGFVDPGESAAASVAAMKQQISDLESGRGGWDAAEYGISRAEQVARFQKSLVEAEAVLAKANTPEGRAEAVRLLMAANEEMVNRAIARAGLDTSNGRVNVMVAGAPAWHKLGVNIASAANRQQAVVLSGQDFFVDKVPVQFDFNGKLETFKGRYVLARRDTGTPFTVVGNRFKVIQNEDAHDFCEAVMGEFGAKYHTAGCLFGGAKIWMQLELPRQAFKVAAGDEVQAFATFVNVHDGSGSAYCYPTTNRVVCNNTLRIASADQGKGIRMPHTGSIEGRIADAQEAVGLAVERFDEFKGQAEVLVRTPVDAKVYFGRVLDQVLEVTAAQAALGAPVLAEKDLLEGIVRTTEARQKAELEYKRAIEARADILGDIIERYESERCGVGGIRGSAWAALNAVTEHTNYYAAGRKVGTENDRNSRAWESVMAGDRDELNQIALADALALAR